MDAPKAMTGLNYDSYNYPLADVSHLSHEEKRDLLRRGMNIPKELHSDTADVSMNGRMKKALELFDLADVWGIGKQPLAKLQYLGIQIHLEFADKKESWVRSHFTKPGCRPGFCPCRHRTQSKLRKRCCLC